MASKSSAKYWEFVSFLKDKDKIFIKLPRLLKKKAKVGAFGKY